LTVDRIFKVIHVENQGLWQNGKAGDELQGDGFADTINVSLLAACSKRDIVAPEASTASSSNGWRAASD